MEIWSTVTQLISISISWLSTNFGMSEALAIIVFTLLARTLLLPVSLTSAYRMQRNKEAMQRIKPLVDDLKIKYKDDPAELASQTMALYRQHGIRFIDKLGLLNMGSQAIFGLGVFKTLNKVLFNSKFLWIANLAKPDYWLTALVGVLMLLGVLLMPGLSFEHSQLLLMLVPVVISVLAVAALPSALGVYWAASNVFTVFQTLALRGLMLRTSAVNSGLTKH